MNKEKIHSNYFEEAANELQGKIINTIEVYLMNDKCGFYSFLSPLRDHPFSGEKISGIDIQSLPNSVVFGVRILDNEILELTELPLDTLIAILRILEKGSINSIPSAN